MAIDGGFYSLKQFQVAVKAETTIGTANVTAMQYLNIDGWPSVSFNPTSFLEPRHSGGRTAKKADVYKSQNGQEKRISLSGIYDQTMGPICFENVTGVATSSSPASIDIPYNYTGGDDSEMLNGDAGISDNLHSLTIALVSPEGSNSIICPGCFLDRFKINAIIGDDGGRFHFEAEFVTRHNLSTGQAAPTTPTPYPSTYRTIYELSAKQSVGAVDVDLYKLELEILANIKFSGFGASGIPSVIARGVPEIVCQGVFGIKYDANTAPIVPKQLDENDIAVEISNNATWASATFGLKGTYGQISSDFDVADVEDGAFIDIPLKFMAHTSGDIIQVVP